MANTITVTFLNHNTRYLETPCELGKVQLYRFSGDHPKGRPWHLVCFGRFFATVADAVEYLQTVVDHWDDKPDPQQEAELRAAEANYQAGYAYACGYYD